MNRILIALLCLLFSLLQAQGQGTYWEATPGPYGGPVTLSKTNNGTLYATFSTEENFGVYRSDDQGLHWHQLPQLSGNSFGSSNTLHIGTLGNFYVKNGAGWLKSDNEGSTWTGLGNGSSQVDQLVETATGTLIAGGGDFLYRSIDGGQTWNTVADIAPGNNHYVYTLIITPAGELLAESSVVSGDQKRVFFRSVDDGQTWQKIEIDATLYSMVIAPSGTIFCSGSLGTQNGLYRSTDWGLTFSFIDPNWTDNSLMTVLASGRLLRIVSSKLYYSDDDGITWALLGSEFGSPNGVEWTFQPIGPLSDGAVFSTILGGLHKSNDGGLTWQFAADGMHHSKIWQMRFRSDSVYYASTPNGLWKTSDRGHTWTRMTTNRTVQNEGSFEITSSGGVVAVQDEKLFWSADGNLSMVEITPPDSLQKGMNWIAVNPQNDHFFITTRHGYARSVNHGQTWQIVLNENGYAPWATCFHPSGRILRSQADMILISDDEGLSWDSVYIPGILGTGTMKIAPDGTVYLFATAFFMYTSLFKSEDAGTTWTFVRQSGWNIHIWTQRYFAIAANGHLYQSDDGTSMTLSVDGGFTWQNVPKVVQNPDDSYLTYSVSISPDQYLYLSTLIGNFKSAAPVSQGAYITGHLHKDADADCSTPDAQAPLKNWVVEADGPFDYYTQTDPNGRYTFFVDTGTYQVSARPVNGLWWALCDSTETVVADDLYGVDTFDFAALALADCPLMSVLVAAPVLRRCFENNVSVQYCNQGTETADSAWVDVTLDHYLSLVTSAQPHDSLGNNVFRFYLGAVESGDCGQFSLTVHVDCDSTVLGQTHCINAHAYPDTLCTPVPNWSGAHIVAGASCQDSAVQLRLSNNGISPSHLLDYIIIEDDVVLMSGQEQYAPGEEITLNLPANGHTWRIESQQEPGHPFSKLALAFAEGCGGFQSLGFINEFSVNAYDPAWQQVCVENNGSYDPNDKQGFPRGTGADHQIRPGQEIDYLIRFQNTGTDTAFTVVIRDTLSPWLDPASVRPGAASHPYTWELSGPGLLQFRFDHILLPDSNTNLAASQGFVSFRIAQQPEVPLGTQILNTAAIYFDFNTPVITNQTLHTVGKDYLTGTHSPAPARRPNAVTVSPNPAAEACVLQLETGAFRQHRLILTDVLGRKVQEAEISGAQYRLERRGLPAGAYFFRVEDAAGKRVDAGRVVFD